MHTHTHAHTPAHTHKYNYPQQSATQRHACVHWKRYSLDVCTFTYLMCTHMRANVVHLLHTHTAHNCVAMQPDSIRPDLPVHTKTYARIHAGILYRHSSHKTDGGSRCTRTHIPPEKACEGRSDWLPPYPGDFTEGPGLQSSLFNDAKGHDRCVWEFK